MGARKRICGVEGRSREKRSLIEVASALGGAVVSAPRLHALLEGKGAYLVRATQAGDFFLLNWEVVVVRDLFSGFDV
jgi:hypothetical protein